MSDENKKAQLEEQTQTIMVLDDAIDKFMSAWKYLLSQSGADDIETAAELMHKIYHRVADALNPGTAAYLTAALLKVHLNGGFSRLEQDISELKTKEEKLPSPAQLRRQSFAERMKEREQQEQQNSQNFPAI